MYKARMEVDMERLKALRKEQVLTLRELAELSGVSKDSISRIERTGMARQTTIRKLAAGLGVEARELIKKN